MTDYVYPDGPRLELIAQDLLPRLTADRPIFDLLPIQNDDDDLLRWEILDNFKGLQQVRGLNGDPPRVNRLGASGYIMQPGYYGEQQMIDEREITKRRAFGQSFGPVDITQLVMQCQELLLQRRLDRIEYIGWTLVATGTFAISNANGVVLHTDTFPLQTFTATVTWATFATATPLADLRAVRLLGRGHSVDFGARAKAYANQTTINNLLLNSNGNDLFGRRGQMGSTFNSLTDDNRILLENDLPQLVPYDAGYLNDAGAFQLFIPNGKIVVVGARPGNAPVGNYRLTRNAQNDGAAPGPYMKVVDNPNDVPRKIVMHDGHNGGPVVYWPSAIVIMNV